MKAKTIIYGIILIFVFSIVLGLTGNTNDVEHASAEVPVVVEEEPTVQDVIKSEIKKEGTWDANLDSYTVGYNDETRTLSIDMVYHDPLNAKSFRKVMNYNTMEMLEVVSKHQADVDYVFITGYTDMMDQRGNVNTDRVYYVQVGTERASQVNWNNLMGSEDMEQDIRNNVDSMWMHPGVRG